MIKFNIVAVLALTCVITSTQAIKMKAKVVPEEADMTGEMPEDMYTADDMVLIKREVEVKEVDVTDASGQEARLIIYKGILEQPIWYQEFGRAGYLSNEQGDLVDLEGQILITKEDLVEHILAEKRGEPVDMMQAVKVMDIKDEGDDLPEDMVGLPSVELEQGMDACCQSSGCFCKPKFNCDCSLPLLDSCKPCCFPKLDCCSCQPKCDCFYKQCCMPKCDCCMPKCGCCTTSVCKGQVKTICKPKPYCVPVLCPKPKPVPYIVEVPVRVPITKTVCCPIHVPVKVPVKCPVYVKEYVPNYIKKIIPVEKKVCKTFTKIINVEKPIIKTCIKKVKICCPIVKKEIVPICKKCYVKKPYPVYVKEYYPVTKCVNKYVKCPVVEKKYVPITEIKKIKVCKPKCCTCSCCQPQCCQPQCCFQPTCDCSCQPSCGCSYQPSCSYSLPKLDCDCCFQDYDCGCCKPCQCQCAF